METQYNNCDSCMNKGFDLASGVICQLTNVKPPEDYMCDSYVQNNAAYKEMIWKEKVDKSGKRKSRVRVLLSIVLVVTAVVFVYLRWKKFNDDIGRAGAEAIGSLFH